MTQTLQTKMERQLNLDYFYEAAKKAMTTKDFKQAQSLAKSGLNEAKDLNNTHWIDLYSEMLSNIPDPKESKNKKSKKTGPKSEKKEVKNLTKINGIGIKLQETLKENGLNTISDLAEIPIEKLCEIKGIGPTTAESIISNAKALLQKEEKFSPKKGSELDSESKRKVPKKNEKKSKEDTPQVIVEDIPYKAREEQKISKPPEKLKIEESEKKKGLKKLGKESLIDPLLKAENTLKSKTSLKELQQKLAIKDNEKSVSKKIDKIRENHKKKVAEKKAKRNYYEISEKSTQFSPVIRNVFSKFDYRLFGLKKHFKEVYFVALREIKKDENTSTIVIHPIQKTKGSSNASKCQPSSRLRKKIRKNISKKRVFFKLIKDKFYSNLELKQTITKRPLFLHSGNKEVNLLVEPIVLTEDLQANMHDSNPFNFSKKYKLYISDKDHIGELLIYTENKYEVIEEINDSQNSIETYIESSKEFNRILLYISVPFFILSLIFNFLLITQINEFLLEAFLYPSISLFLILLGYSLIHYRKNIKNVKEAFIPSLYDISVPLKGEPLNRAMEKLDGDHLKQFFHEFEEKGKTEESKGGENQDKLEESQKINETRISENLKNEDLQKEEEYTQGTWDKWKDNPLFKEVQKKNPNFLED
jgi:predicted flap endonuclease-1-like 5' DNA nuclease